MMKLSNSNIAKSVILVLITLCSITSTQAKNTYASVSSVAGSVVTLNAGHSGSFVVGEEAMIMQMKGASIMETNGATYGAVTDYNGAGTYQIATVLAVSPNDITLDINVDAYDVNANVQLISIPAADGSGDYTEDGSNTPPDWNGHTGGVYVINICGTYNLTGNLQTEGGGFRGGLTNETGDFYGALPQQWVASDVEDFAFGAFIKK